MAKDVVLPSQLGDVLFKEKNCVGQILPSPTTMGTVPWLQRQARVS